MQKSLIQITVLAFPVLLFFGVFFGMAVNVPWFDDIEALHGFTLRFLDAPTLSEKFYWLLQPNNEHRMVSGKLTALASILFLGELNYVWIEAAANLSIVVIAILLFRSFRGRNYWYFLPVLLILFQPQYHLLTFWAITGTQHQFTMAWVCLALFFLVRVRLFWAIGFALLATFSMSNGMFVWLAGATLLALRGQFKSLVLWGTAAFLCIFGYFYAFDAGANANSFNGFLKNPTLSLSAFFTFLGGLFDFTPNAQPTLRYALPTMMGIVITWLVGTLFFKEFPFRSWFRKSVFQPEKDFLLGVLVFVFINTAIIAVLRPHFGYFVMLISNYKLYPTLAVAVVYILWIQQSSISLARILPLGLLVWLVSYWVYLPEIANRRRLLLAATYNQIHAGVGLGATRGTPLEDFVRTTVDSSVHRKFYHPPLEIFTGFEKLPADSLAVTIQKNTDKFVFSNTNFVYPFGLKDAVWVVIQHTQNTENYVLATQPIQRNRNFFVPKGVGFSVALDKRIPSSGNYTVEVWVSNNLSPLRLKAGILTVK